MYNIFPTKTKRYNIKYKCGVNVTQNIKEAIKFDNDNINTLCSDAIGKEMTQNKDFHTFIRLKRGPKALSDHIFVPVHM